MRTLLVAAFALLSLSAIGQTTKNINIGDGIPEAKQELKNIDGQAVTLASQAGKNGLLVMFSCNTCPFVVRNQHMTLKTIAYAKEHNMGVVIINSNAARRSSDDSYDAMVKYAKEQGYTVPYVMDNKTLLADAFGAGHTPELFLFNGAGKLAYKGAMNDNPGEPMEAKTMFIFNAIDAVANGKTPDPAVTKSVGCSIKR